VPSVFLRDYGPYYHPGEGGGYPEHRPEYPGGGGYPGPRPGEAGYPGGYRPGHAVNEGGYPAGHRPGEGGGYYPDGYPG